MGDLEVIAHSTDHGELRRPINSPSITLLHLVFYWVCVVLKCCTERKETDL